MKKRVVSAILVSAAIVSLNASKVNAFGIPKVKIPDNPVANMVKPATNSGAEYSGQIGTINSSVANADSYMNNSVFALSQILLNKDTLQELELKKQEILSKDKSKEKGSAMNQVATDYIAAIQAENAKGMLDSKVSQLSDEQKKLYSNAVFNVGLAGLNYTDAGLKATSLVQSISANPTAATGMIMELKQLKKISYFPARAG